MANMLWLRLYHEMPNDPKWRVIARKSGRSIAEVQAVFLQILVSASVNGDRGCASINDEDIAASLDIEPEDVSCIREAMQGRVLDGEEVTGWGKRNPLREDDSAERVRKHRDAKRVVVQPTENETPCNEIGPTEASTNETVTHGNAMKHTVTHGNAMKHTVTLEKKREEENKDLPSRVREREKPANPDAGAEFMCALYLCEELAIPSDHGTRLVIADAIRMKARSAGGLERATEGMILAAREAKQRGDVINRFWFSDQRYEQPAKKGNSHGAGNTSAAHERTAGNRRALAAALERRGIDSACLDARPDASPVSAGSVGCDGGTALGLRTAGLEVHLAGSGAGPR